MPRTVVFSEEIEPTAEALSARLGLPVKAFESIGWSAALERKVGNVNLWQEMRAMADLITYDMPRAGETATARNLRLAAMERAFAATRERWLATVPPEIAIQIRQADAAGRAEILRGHRRILAGIVRDDIAAALTRLNPFADLQADCTVRAREELPDGQRFEDAEVQAAFQDLCQSLRLRRLVGEPMTYELASQPFMRLLIQTGVLCIASPTLAQRLAVPVSPPIGQADREADLQTSITR